MNEDGGGVPPTPAEISGSLERILESDGFRNSERLRRFLRVTVEATLAGQGRVSVVAFSDSGPGASPSAPLRTAELASPPGAKSGYLTSVLALLRAQQAPYLATSLSLARLDGQETVRIEFAAPSPLGLLSG